MEMDAREKKKKKHLWHVVIHADTGHTRRRDFKNLWFLKKVGETAQPGSLETLSFHAILLNCLSK